MQHAQPLTSGPTVQHLHAFVAEELRAGVDRETIIARLEERGLSRGTAAEFVQRLRATLGPVVTTQSAGGFSSLLKATVGGGLAAVIGGAVWAAIVIFTGYEIGYVAWGVGLAAGLGVVIFAGGRRGIPFQVVAVMASVLGIAIGKYGAFFHFLKQAAAEEYGAEVVAQISMLSMGAIQFFVASLAETLNGFDALWILLAVSTAWGIAKQRGEEELDPEV